MNATYYLGILVKGIVQEKYINVIFSGKLILLFWWHYKTPYIINRKNCLYLYKVNKSVLLSAALYMVSGDPNSSVYVYAASIYPLSHSSDYLIFIFWQISNHFRENGNFAYTVFWPSGSDKKMGFPFCVFSNQKWVQ